MTNDNRAKTLCSAPKSKPAQKNATNAFDVTAKTQEKMWWLRQLR